MAKITQPKDLLVHLEKGDRSDEHLKEMYAYEESDRPFQQPAGSMAALASGPFVDYRNSDPS